MKAKEIKIVKPKPYYQISFGCSNMAFHDVKNDLYGIFKKLNLEEEFNDGYFTEQRDYEGDLEKIIVHNEKRSKEILKEILNLYGGNIDELGGMDLVLSIF